MTGVQTCALPISRDFPICVEIQNAQFVNKTIYRRWIELDLSPVFHIWPGMPPLSRQWNLYLEAGGGEKSLPLLVSASVHPDCSPEEAVVLFQPYQAIRRENPEGRAFFSEFRPWIMKNDRKAFIIIGNRWEGCAPISISLVANSLMREG